MEAILAIVGKYWLDFILGLVATALTVTCKKIWTLYKNEKNHQKTEELKKFYAGLEKLIKEGNDASIARAVELQGLIDILKAGVLCILGQHFKKQCAEFLEEEFKPVLHDYEVLRKEHETYNKLGGNSEGDDLFLLCKEKFENLIVK